MAYDALQLRLRFVLAVTALALMAAAWPWLASGWERVLARFWSHTLDPDVTAGAEYFCPMDPGVVSAWPAICPICNMDLIKRQKTDAVILPSGIVARMQLSPYRIALAGVRTVPVTATAEETQGDKAGSQQALLVPATSVVHRGAETLVYVESMPGMFDGVPVELRQRMGETYVVRGGLTPGQRVVAMGTLLLDAETRLNPNLATQYFGAATQVAASPPPAVKRAGKQDASWKGLDAADAALAEAQRYCPVTRAKLGSMGTPVFVLVSDRRLALCCAGCRGRILAEPAKYLDWLDEKLASERAPK